MNHKEKEELLLSSLGSEEELNEEGYNFLNQDLNLLHEQNLNIKQNCQLYDPIKTTQHLVDAKSIRDNFYHHTKDQRDKVSSPIAYLCTSDSRLNKNIGNFRINNGYRRF